MEWSDKFLTHDVETLRYFYRHAILVCCQNHFKWSGMKRANKGNWKKSWRLVKFPRKLYDFSCSVHETACATSMTPLCLNVYLFHVNGLIKFQQIISLNWSLENKTSDFWHRRSVYSNTENLLKVFMTVSLGAKWWGKYLFLRKNR